MDKDNELRHRGLSIGSSPFANLPKYSSTIAKRSNSTVTGLAPRSIRIVVLGVGGVGKTGELTKQTYFKGRFKWCLYKLKDL